MSCEPLPFWVEAFLLAAPALRQRGKGLKVDVKHGCNSCSLTHQQSALPPYHLSVINRLQISVR